jgi:dihydrofolate reductase
MRLSIICAIDKAGGFGFKRGLPWRFPEELQWFREVTTGHHVVMGRLTWESLPPAARPLKGRTNHVLSSQEDLDLPEGVHRIESLDELLSLEKDAQVFVIGGKRAIEEAFKSPFLESIYLTLVDGIFPSDVRLPSLIALAADPSAKVFHEGNFVNRKDDKLYTVRQYVLNFRETSYLRLNILQTISPLEPSTHGQASPR